MTKVVLLMKRKAGLSFEEFKDYYERNHAPLAKRLLGEFMLDYRRNYRSGGIATEQTDAPDGADFDVITEIWYKDQASMEAMWAHARKPEIAAEIDADGDKFMDREMRFYIVEECR
jgi:uncharacterized protein (TIGR02118 family)